MTGTMCLLVVQQVNAQENQTAFETRRTQDLDLKTQDI
ncbi:hypothetical protein NUACC26_005820 [Scytonema sp. NUACC26]